MTTKAAIYIRQSQTSEGTISPALQRRNCEAFVKRQGWELVDKSYEDIDISGKRTVNRPGYLALRSDYDNGKFDVVVADDWSRFARNEVEGLSMLGSMQLASASQGIYDEDTNHLPTAIQFIIDADFSRKMGKRWRNALIYRLEKGLPPSGKNQFGYDKQGKEAYVQNADADILREAYRRYIAGEGARTICEDFNARGLNSAGPNGWHATGFFDLLDKVFYAGRIGYEGQEFPGAHEPILDAAQWAAYQKARASRKLQTKPRNPKWMLAGLVVCGRCGGKMVSHMARGVPNLMCATYNAQGKAGCAGTFRKRSKVQTAVWYWLGAHLDEWASTMPTDEEGKLAADKAVADAEAALESARETYKAYQKFAFENGIRPEESKASLAEYSTAIDQAQGVLDEAMAELGSLTPAADIHEQISNGALLMGFEADPDAEPSEAATAQFREALSKIIAKVIIHPSTGTSPRDPNRDHRAEVEIVPVRG